MFLYPYFELAATLFILLFALQLHLWHHENRSARFFVRFAIASFFACIFSYSLRIAFTLELAAHLDRIATTLTALSFALYVHFAFIFTRKEHLLKKRPVLFSLYAPVVLVAALAFFSNWIYVRYDLNSYGIVGQPGMLYFIFAAQMLLSAAVGIYLFLVYSKTALQKIVRQQSLAIAWGTIIPLVIGIVFDQALTMLFGEHVVPPTFIFDCALMNLFIYLAMRNYSLFAISPSLAAKAIIETMPDSLLVTDLDGRIIFLNEEAHKFFHVPKKEITGNDIRQLFEDGEKYQQLYNEVVFKKMKISRFEAVLRDPLGERIPSLINATILREDLGAALGIIFICRDVRG